MDYVGATPLIGLGLMCHQDQAPRYSEARHTQGCCVWHASKQGSAGVPDWIHLPTASRVDAGPSVFFYKKPCALLGLCCMRGQFRCVS